MRIKYDKLWNAKNDVRRTPLCCEAINDVVNTLHLYYSTSIPKSLPVTSYVIRTLKKQKRKI